MLALDVRTSRYKNRTWISKQQGKPRIIEMAATNPFRGVEKDNPYRHIKRFTTLCNMVCQEGVPGDWFKWNLFPYSLVDEAIK
jgi:hypothetical protein